MGLVSCSSTSSNKTSDGTSNYTCKKAEGAAAPVKLWEASGIANPESVVWDEKSQSYFVSSVGGSPVEKDGNGYISRLNTSGKILQKTWSTGKKAKQKKNSSALNAPKGMRIQGSILWVADIDELVGIQISNASVVRRIKIEGAKFLNDVAFDPSGKNVIVSDMMGSVLFSVSPDDQVTKLSEGESLEFPNGLLNVGDALLVASWGPGIKDDFSTDKPGQILSYDWETRVLKPWNSLRLGNLDGIEADGADALMVSDWMNGKVYRVTRTGECTTYYDATQGAADIAWNSKERVVVVPRMNENLVTAYKIAP